MINIKIQDLDFENDVMIFKHTKNRRGQIIPMSLSLKNVLLEYLQYRQFENEEDWLFCNSYGEKMNETTLSGNLRAYNRRRGVMRTGIHRFRHTFAKKWILMVGMFSDYKNFRSCRYANSKKLCRDVHNRFTERF
ncbi:phage integrase family protein [Clostridium botulinum CFSAN001627]|uniref:Phage integrase family protein n=1 Tax=Clostridium botulinum CFSAN001627 TaxID=1232189 RepID=M1ZT24_CLOBO|nr:phage integrase family protein [Clostridium botulinum CFSAN001627]